MAIKLEQGDYALKGSAPVPLRGQDAAFADALFRLQCRRGSFPFLPELGSRLWRIGLERRSDRDALARQFCAEALSGCAVQARDVSVREQGRALAVELTLTLGDAAMNVEVKA